MDLSAHAFEEGTSNHRHARFTSTTRLPLTAQKKRKFKCLQARLAQSAERKALNLVVVGSSPTVGVFSKLGRRKLWKLDIGPLSWCKHSPNTYQFARNLELPQTSASSLKLPHASANFRKTWAQNQNSATGTRTRVARVRAEYPNQLDYGGHVHMKKRFNTWAHVCRDIRSFCSACALHYH